MINQPPAVADMSLTLLQDHACLPDILHDAQALAPSWTDKHYWHFMPCLGSLPWVALPITELCLSKPSGLFHAGADAAGGQL